MPILDYSRWENFTKVINKAKVACSNSNNIILENFRDVTKVLKVGNNADMSIADIQLTRYAC